MCAVGGEGRGGQRGRLVGMGAGAVRGGGCKAECSEIRRSVRKVSW